MILYLIRHGKTEANLKHLYCGATNLLLSEEGRTELEMRKQERKEIWQSLRDSQNRDFRFISSGMQRCNETLEILLGITDFEVIPEFREIDFGAFEMHSYEELKDNPVYQEWISGDNQAKRPPCGESGNEMKERVLEAFEEVAEDGKDAVIVTHGGVIAAILEALFVEEGKNMYQWQPKPGNGYRLAFDGAGWSYEEI